MTKKQGLRSAAYRAGFADGIDWDLSDLDESDVNGSGWSDATIAAVGLDAFCEACGIERAENGEIDDSAWSTAVADYNAGAYDGATAPSGRTGSPCVKGGPS